jgi:hypothetical protein
MAMPHDSEDPNAQTRESESVQPSRDARVFRDLTGAQWFAHEVSGETLGGGAASLLLVSAQQIRRIAPCPAHWRTLSPAALLELPYSSL